MMMMMTMVLEASMTIEFIERRAQRKQKHKRSKCAHYAEQQIQPVSEPNFSNPIPRPADDKQRILTGRIDILLICRVVLGLRLFCHTGAIKQAAEKNKIEFFLLHSPSYQTFHRQ
uniref:Uncharacterized protein n=1 Tax=Anopheles minimus TaxID=112268 RepID=A0A182WNT0_9DIPT